MEEKKYEDFKKMTKEELDRIIEENEKLLEDLKKFRKILDL